MRPSVHPPISTDELRRTAPRHARRILCVFPQYAHSFGTFQHAYPLVPGVKAFMPPQGILVIAAFMPPHWSVRFVDENVRPVTEKEYQWADAVLVSGMHVQRLQIERIIAAAHRHGKIAVVGGPSASACPEYYPTADIVHAGELGDATEALIAMLDASVTRPRQQIILRTADRLPLDQFPQPAYHLLNMRWYFMGSVQFSSGCPFLCEFCDIPELYGRNPRMKRPDQVVAELDAMLAQGLRNAVYFVDDNFIANPAAAKELLPALIHWQRRTGYPIHFSCEATLNIAKHTDLLAMMREARFVTVFCGIETPEPQALELMRKTQNMRSPILQSIRTLNEHGLEVVSGIILGLDTDTPQTGDRVLQFIEASKIPILTINLLYALPRTPLHERLSKARRIIDDPSRASNVAFLMPYEQVLSTWRRVVGEAYDPARLFERLEYQSQHCFDHRLEPKRKVTARMAADGLSIVRRVMWHVGARADYRRHFWRVCGPLLRRGRIEQVLHIGVVARHLIRFARQCARDDHEASFYHNPNAESDVRWSATPAATVEVTIDRRAMGLPRR